MEDLTGKKSVAKELTPELPCPHCEGKVQVCKIVSGAAEGAIVALHIQPQCREFVDAESLKDTIGEANLAAWGIVMKEVDE